MKSRLVVLVLFAFVQIKSFAQSHLTDNTSFETGLVKVSVMYPYAEDKSFNMDYYKTNHMPRIASLLGTNLVKYTIEKGVSSGIPNTALPYFAIGSFYVKSLDSYLKAVGPKRNEIRADFANYTNVSPVILISEVIK